MVKSKGGKIVLATLALLVAVLSLVLVIIYASLACDVIDYALTSERENWEGLGAAVGFLLMIVFGVGIVILAIVSLIMFICLKRAEGALGIIVKVTFIYHVSVTALAIIALMVTRFMV